MNVLENERSLDTDKTPNRGMEPTMNYYKRLLGQARDGAPSFREANDDYARMLDARYAIFRPLGDHRGRHHR